jgi:hypothetical protein
MRAVGVVLLMAVTCPAFAFLRAGVEAPEEDEATQAPQKKPQSTANVKVKVSAEGKAVLPSGSKIQWEGIGATCRNVRGEKTLQSAGATPVSLPACKVRFTVFVTGFDTKAVTVDLAGKEDKFDEPILISIKRQGPAQVTW